ncbi:MAG TPA: DUF2848 domain-containing protein [Caldimonas sp.]|jgi:hypothetical protein|nr:DUF2848 domain-containing protein [Caldimonas sp.]HEX2541982.1 DUF2848 domain-containing protein [Caldimonas sp.]
MNLLRFALLDGGTLEAEPTRLVVAGWTGRDGAAIEHHIEELARLGVPRPSAVPLYYRLSAGLLTQADTLEMLGDASSGEAEPVFVRQGGRWWLTVGSDHTDRAVEAYSVVVSKQMCAKPVARAAWPWDEVAARADELVLRSEILEDGRWVTYQEGSLSAIRPLQSLIDGLPADVTVADGLVLFCGTLAAIPNAAGQAIRPAPGMRVELVDPVASQRISHRYRVGALPMVA